MQVFRWSGANSKMLILLWTVTWSQNKLYISNEMGIKKKKKRTRKIDLNIKDSSREKKKNSKYF